MSGACPIKKTDEAPAAARVSRSQERRALAAQQTVDDGGDHEVVETESRVTCFQFPRVDHCAWMVCRRGGSSHGTAGVAGCAAAFRKDGAGRADVARNFGSDRRTDRIVPGRAGCAGPRSLDLPDRSRGSRPMDATAFRPDGRGTRPSGRSENLGSQRKGSDAVPVGPCKHGQEPFLDLGARGCLCEPAAGCAQCGSGDAWPSAASGELEEHVAGDREERGTEDRDSTGKPRGLLRTGIRSWAYLRMACW